MNFIVSSSYLLKNLNSISGVITSNPVVPILENVLFEIDGGNLLITASDLQTSVMVELQVESKEDGSTERFFLYSICFYHASFEKYRISIDFL